MILTEGWFGVSKCIIFIVDCFYKEFLELDSNNTLKFLSDMKQKSLLRDKMEKKSFKKFLKKFDFTEPDFFLYEFQFNLIN